MNESSQIYDALIGGGAAGGVIALMLAWIIKYWLTAITRKNEDLKKELGDLKDNRIHKLENDISNLDDDLEEHITADDSKSVMGELKHVIDNISKLSSELERHILDDNSKAVMTELKHIVGNLSKIADKVDKFGADTAKQQAQIDAVNHYVKNLDTSFQRHKEHKHA